MRTLFLIGALVSMTVTAQAENVKLFAAGSLKAALSDVARAFEGHHQGKSRVEATFAASGLLRERIEKEKAAHVFASADLGHPRKLIDGGLAASTLFVFARNQLCALAKPDLKVTSAMLLDTLLDPAVRVGISTPKADPSGDYAWTLFAKAEAVKPGVRGILEGKALQLTGGSASEKAPEGRNQYAWVLEKDRADIFLTYCTNAVLAQKELPALQIVQIEPELNVGAEYGMIVLKDAPQSATLLARFIMGEGGPKILGQYGFGRGDTIK
jgi:molybdate transport system substrate-binding protein